jgi:PEP-CTERM motif
MLFGNPLATERVEGRARMLSSKIKFIATSFPLVLLLSVSALANTCNNFSSYTCAQTTPNTVHILGQGPTNSSVGTTGGLITGNSFGVQMMGNSSASDIIIAAYFNGAPGGTLNGQSFTSTGIFPESAAIGAITTTLGALNIPISSTPSYGYVDLHTSLAANTTLTVNVAGLPVGTVIYGLALNPVTTCSHGKHGSTTCTTSDFITNITPNSEAGMIGSTVPEPGTLALFGTGLLSLTGVVRRRLFS